MKAVSPVPGLSNGGPVYKPTSGRGGLKSIKVYRPLARALASQRQRVLKLALMGREPWVP